MKREPKLRKIRTLRRKSSVSRKAIRAAIKEVMRHRDPETQRIIEGRAPLKPAAGSKLDA